MKYSDWKNGPSVCAVLLIVGGIICGGIVCYVREQSAARAAFADTKAKIAKAQSLHLRCYGYMPLIPDDKPYEAQVWATSIPAESLVVKNGPHRTDGLVPMCRTQIQIDSNGPNGCEHLCDLLNGKALRFSAGEHEYTCELANATFELFLLGAIERSSNLKSNVTDVPLSSTGLLPEN
jgi:hypothetical protein